jgi:hypothetical protein
LASLHWETVSQGQLSGFDEEKHYQAAKNDKL